MADHNPLGSPWIPLGSAHVINWKQLGRGGSQQGALAWISYVERETVLLRAWTNEATTVYEFSFLSLESLSGRIVVTTEHEKAGPIRLRLQVEAGEARYAELVEFAEHPRTGLFGSVRRDVEASDELSALSTILPPGAADLEVYLYAPESALLTRAGQWLQNLLTIIRASWNQFEMNLPHGDVSVPVESPPSPAPSEPPDLALDDDFPASAANGRAMPQLEPESEPEPAPPPEPELERPPETRATEAQSERRLVCATNTGDSWEIQEAEVYIGRSKQCSIVLKSQRVSRRHALISREEDGYYIRDLGAANGIWSGTEKVDFELIREGSEYIVGDVVLRFTYQ